MTKTIEKNTVSDNVKKKWLNTEEIKAVLASAKKRSLRDYLLILMSYRHGLRSKEVTLLRYSWIDFDRGTIWIERVKGSISMTHPLNRDELKLIKKYMKNLSFEKKLNNNIFGVNTSRIRQICQEIALDTNILFHHHRLRHTCGFDMAIKGVDTLVIKNYLGHKNIQNTMVYVDGAGRQFDRLSQWYQC